MRLMTSIVVVTLVLFDILQVSNAVIPEWLNTWQQDGSCGRRPHFYKQGKLYMKHHRKIAGGYAIKRGDFPSFVQVAKDKDGEYGNHCSGVLISQQIVLTAAHCFENLDGPLVVSANVAPPHKWTGEDIKTVANYCNDSYYVPGKIDAYHDFGVLILDKPFELSEDIQTACLPEIPLQPEEKVIAVGGGQEDDYGTRTGVKALPMKEIDCGYSTDFTGKVCFTAYDSRYIGDTCRGDSGGPLYVSRQGVHYVVALTSNGSPECQAGSSGLAENVDLYLNMPFVSDLIRNCEVR